MERVVMTLQGKVRSDAVMHWGLSADTPHELQKEPSLALIRVSQMLQKLGLMEEWMEHQEWPLSTSLALRL